MDLKPLSNSELANEMVALTKRFGDLSLWITEHEVKIYNMITTNSETPSAMKASLELKHGAEAEKWLVLSNLKKIELEMDKRVGGA